MDSDIYYYAVSTSMPSNGIGISSPGVRSARVGRPSLTIFFDADSSHASVKAHPVQQRDYDRRQPGFRVLDT